MSQILSEHFWVDLERHPGIDTLRLPLEAVRGWKQRIRVLPDGQPRLHYEAMLLAVRAFYLDLRHWAVEQPELWEVRRMRWLGEVAALEECLRYVDAKKQHADQLRRQAEEGQAGAVALA